MDEQSVDAGDNGSPAENEAALIRRFVSLLQAEEENQKTRLRTDPRGIVMRVALNELDWHHYLLRKRIEPTQELIEASYVVGLGLTRIVGLMLRLHEAFTLPTITIVRDERLSSGVLDVAAELGFVEHGRRVAEQAWAGLARVSLSAPNVFDFELPRKLVDARAHEREIEDYFKREATRHLNDIIAGKAGERLGSEVNSLLRENVYVWRDRFMGYHADPTLDEFFMQLAWNSMQQTPQYDSFNERKTFGGIPYLKYLLAATYLVSLCLKHERFCEALIEKEPGIRIEDILTISSDRDEFVATMREALNQFGQGFDNYTSTTLDEAQKIYEVIALTRRNVGLIEKPFPPVPAVVEFSESAIVTLLAGRHRQMEFLLDSLKSAYARDFSRNRRARETSMQRALGLFIQHHFGNAITLGNVRLRLKGRELTDVDFAAIDPNFGDLFLFQLKYQDHHGQDFRVQKSRMTRFLEESTRWLTAVETWLKASTSDTIRTAFRTPRAVEIKRIRKIIIARHHAYPLATITLDENTAYASWLQLYNAGEFMRATQGDIRTLNGLFQTLRTHVVGASEFFHEDQEAVEYRLAEVSYCIRQPEIDPTAEDPATAGAENTR